jgi:hypothetical protein
VRKSCKTTTEKAEIPKAPSFAEPTAGRESRNGTGSPQTQSREGSRKDRGPQDTDDCLPQNTPNTRKSCLTRFLNSFRIKHLPQKASRVSKAQHRVVYRRIRRIRGKAANRPGTWRGFLGSHSNPLASSSFGRISHHGFLVWELTLTSSGSNRTRSSGHHNNHKTSRVNNEPGLLSRFDRTL